MTGFVVADAGPLISYARAGQLPLLRQVLPQLYATPIVYRELTGAGADRPGVAEILAEGWVVPYPAPDPARVTAIPLDPGSGEQEAAALAQELGLPLLADDRKAYRVAQRLGLQIMTSLRVLAAAKREGRIPAVRQPSTPSARTASASARRFTKSSYSAKVSSKSRTRLPDAP